MRRWESSKRLGIRPVRMEEVGGGRKATILDPDGNTVAIIEVPTTA